ncbi:hypothetical protein BFP72_18300 [Reichenbachiella sp. 5M10]|nr:hypothetical protein BFP72_18300 [Reichenbachiella sp. 5M10]
MTQYLARIRSPRNQSLSINYLRQLHLNHLLNIPFENLDIGMRQEILLDPKRLFDKIVLRRRGGFCYELNGLFYQLLQSLGFDVQMIAARVYDKTGSLGPALDHMALLVHLNHNAYLCDVGFGDSFSSPKIMYPGEIQMDLNRYFRIDKDADGHYTLSMSEDSVLFETKYLFSKKEYQLVEFIDMCQYHQSSPKSHFTKGNVITQALPTGRVTLSDTKLVRHHLGERSEQNILNSDEFCVLLNQHFGIVWERNLS